MANLNPDEERIVKAAQLDIADMKRMAIRVEGLMRDLAKINWDAGRMTAGNAAMRFGGAVTALRGALIVAHADASDALVTGYDDGAKMVAMGPGR